MTYGDMWPEVALGEFAEVNPPRPLARGQEAPYVDMAALPAKARRIDPERVVRRVCRGGGARFRNGDTLLARITPCLENGKTALVSGFGADETCQGSTEFIVLGPRTPEDAAFLYYLARSPAFRQYAIQRMEGTSGRQRVAASAVASYRFRCPGPGERRAIGAALSLLDDRIELCAETRTTLEAIAGAVFHSWFLRFDPVRVCAGDPAGVRAGADDPAPVWPAGVAARFPDGFVDSPLGPIPRGWQVTTLGRLAEVGSGRRPPVREDEPGPAAPVPVYGGAGPMAWTAAPLTDGPVIVTGRVGTLGRVFWVDDPCWPSDNTLVITASEEVRHFVYFHLKAADLAQRNRGSTQPLLTQADVREIPVVLPDAPALRAFRDVAAPLFERMRALARQADTLAALRDALLPRLLSGELRVPAEVK